ncbi:TlpA disulfide reductase family protein [Conexibacter sp. SYSU D00693]|uniref:TlpA family protein disulfide reductase n=1 Tax=Conexibacter sp. SYSU D00693 TaxID=2812560 RepID=UPI00196B18E6|nr:TlpA disulfide reductase family protein [Conexibacter sp. SYSU D00693]
MRRPLLALAAVALVAVLVIGLTQAGGKDDDASKPRTVSLADQQAALRGAPAEVARGYARPNAIVDASPSEVERTVDALRGRHPVVVNKWASWCGPCRFEFPFLQQAVERYGKRIAFLGLNSGDNKQDAQRFLERFPVAYVSFEDPDEKAALRLDASAAYPVTVFQDRNGERFVHAGGYASAEALFRDLERHALR